MLEKNDPLLHWALKTWAAEVTPTGVKFTATTNHLCHLWIYWTDKNPWKHVNLKDVRGADIGRAARYCCVARRIVLQEEADDTLDHTFLVEPWPACEQRWFRFKGTVQAQDSPSDSPCFTYHRIGPEYELIILEPWTVTLEPPDMTLIILEPWTVIPEPPEWKEVINEPWTS